MISAIGAGDYAVHLEHLVYISRATAPSVSVTTVSDILEQAARHNSSNNITGCLAFTETHFVQILEGSHSSLDVLLLKLLLDERHTALEVLDRQHVTNRSFAEWSMISPKLTPVGQRRLVKLIADDCRSVPEYLALMLDLCAEQMKMTGPH